MKVLHFAENSTEVEIVELLAHNVNRNNRLSVIMTEDGQIKMTGGHLFYKTPKTHFILNKLVKENNFTVKELFNFFCNIKYKPTDGSVREYFEEC